MSENLRDLSKLEWKLMNICWKKKGKVRAREVYDETLSDKQRSYFTIKTVMDRLVEKGYLRRERFGPLWLYEPTVERSGVLEKEVKNFVTNVLDNTIAPLFKYFAKGENISPEELSELKKIIDKIE